MDKKGLNQIIAVVLLIFLVFIAILAVLVSIKTLTKSVETRSENLQAELEKPLKKEVVECVSGWDCGDLGECTYSYGITDILEQSIFLEFRKSQLCEDLERCVSNLINEETCSPTGRVIISQVEKCSKKYIEINDSGTGELVSRLELQPGRLDIDIILGNITYCDFCYNGILDEGSEDYVDCDNEGKICRKCAEGEALTLKFDYTLIITIALFVILASIFYYLFLKKKQVKRGEHKLRKKRLKGKKAKAKKRKTRKK